MYTCTRFTSDSALRAAAALRSHDYAKVTMCWHTITGRRPVLTESTRDVRFGSRSALLPAACVRACGDFSQSVDFFLFLYFFEVGVFIPQQMWGAASLQPTAAFLSRWKCVDARGFTSSLTHFMKLLSQPKKKGEKNGNSPLQRRLPNTSFWSVSL